MNLERFKYPPQPHYTVREMFIDYSRERLVAKGKDARHAWTGFNHFMEVDGPRAPKSDATKLTEADIEDYIDARLAKGIVPQTVARELVFVRAAFRNAERRNRIPKALNFELPSGEAIFRRPLTDEEFQLVMSKPMSERLTHFYWLAYHTGGRSRSLEEAKWSQVDFVKRIIDFNVPGRTKNNKRRADDFPITDDLMALLVAWKAQAKDEYVIGLGARGVCSSTYNEAAYVVRELCGLIDPTLVPRHCMRKMFATELFERGADPEVVGHLLRDNPNTLRKHYVKFKQSTLMGVANLRSRASP